MAAQGRWIIHHFFFNFFTKSTSEKYSFAELGITSNIDFFLQMMRVDDDFMIAQS